MPLKLKAIATTFLKPSPANSSTIPSSQLVTLKPGTEIIFDSWKQVSKHYRLDRVQGYAEPKYVFIDHVQMIDSKPPSIVRLNVPYKSQLDNENNPFGSCNVTSIAMCLCYFGIPSADSNDIQLEDELYQVCENLKLNRHLPEHLAELVRLYGFKDDIQRDAKWADVKQHLQKGNPCVVHGYFTDFGHIVAIVGYNEKGWIVNDPYGEWFTEGYDTYVSGAFLTYSYNMMERLCGSDGDLWIHYISK